MIQIPTKIEIKESPGKGMGVFAKENIFQGEVIEIAPLIKLDVSTSSKVLFDYRFYYPKKTGIDRIYVVALGYGSLYNHNNQNNADWREVDEMKFEFFALRDILAGEEICLKYGTSEYFNLRNINWL